MTKLGDYVVTVSGLNLSDLFFNFEHEGYAAAFEGIDEDAEIEDDGPLDAAIREGIAKDAEEFLVCCGYTASDREEFKAALVEDFLARV